MASEQPKEKDPQTDTPQPTPSAPSQAEAPTPSEPSQTAAEAATKLKEVPVEEVPDPDEDDLSDLDDVLDEFAATNISKPTPSSSGPGRPVAQPSAIPSTEIGGAGPGGMFASEEDFAQSLQAGMAELLGDFESNPEMQKQFEDLVKELGEGMTTIQPEAGAVADAPLAKEVTTSTPTAASSSTSAAKSPSAPNAAAPSEASFQETIRATMERMNASNTTATAATTQSAAHSEEDFLAAMLREMESSGGMPGAGSDEDFSKMLLGMMEQLTNKEILYEPMKELHDKFPSWIKENEGKTKREDWERYIEQQRLVGEIVGKFEEKGYSDDKAEYREFIVERMQAVSYHLLIACEYVLTVLCTDASRGLAST
jgi:peroxin-19